jgi:integral membrane sensor domain MASE1
MAQARGFIKDSFSKDAAQPLGNRGTAARFITLMSLAVVYVAATKIGLRLATVNPSATAIWAPTGIALAACLLCGRWIWPGVFVGAFLVNLTTAGSPTTSLAIAAGNTLEALLGS